MAYIRIYVGDKWAFICKATRVFCYHRIYSNNIMSICYYCLIYKQRHREFRKHVQDPSVRKLGSWDSSPCFTVLPAVTLEDLQEVKWIKASRYIIVARIPVPPVGLVTLRPSVERWRSRENWKPSSWSCCSKDWASEWGGEGAFYAAFQTSKIKPEGPPLPFLWVSPPVFAKSRVTSLKL